MERIKGLFGLGKDPTADARAQAASAQRRQLAELAQQQAGLDQQKSRSSRGRGRALLTFLGSGDGQSSLG